MKYAVEMAQMPWYMYIPSFRKTGSGIQKSVMKDTWTHSQQGDLTRLLSFFQSEESKLKWYFELCQKLFKSLRFLLTVCNATIYVNTPTRKTRN
jgi:hypothetical protein